jgi:hypothetical protein
VNEILEDPVLYRGDRMDVVVKPFVPP